MSPDTPLRLSCPCCAAGFPYHSTGDAARLDRLIMILCAGIVTGLGGEVASAGGNRVQWVAWRAYLAAPKHLDEETIGRACAHEGRVCEYSISKCKIRDSAK